MWDKKPNDSAPEDSAPIPPVHPSSILIRTASGLCGNPGPAASITLGGLTTRRGFPAGDDASAEKGRASIREVLARLLPHPFEEFAWCRQVHGRRVIYATKPGLQGDGDALVTTGTSLGLLIAVADCIPVLLWDPSGGPLGAAHAGWRGLLAGVLPATVAALRQLGAPVSKLHAWIGPSISIEHFEVGKDVASQFPERYVFRESDRARTLLSPASNSDQRPWKKPHVDLKAMARDQLTEAGLPFHHVDLCGDCTFARDDLYFSYRRDRGICGRHLAYLVRREA